MRTILLLMAQYDMRPIISVDEVARDNFTHLSPASLVRKTETGEIDLPVMRMEGSTKSAKGVHVEDLAAYIDKQAEEARRELARVRRELNREP